MEEFLELVSEKYNNSDLILRAYEYAKEMHKNQYRLSGEPYIVHPVAVAKYLMDLGLDEETIAAALLHDVVEDTSTSYKKLKEMFGENVEKLVKAVSKINNIRYSDASMHEMDSLKRLFIAMGKDIRVVLIKLADRYHNVQTVSALPYERRIKFCTETMNLFVPLAERLGLNNMKGELEDMCFKVLKPEEYDKLKDELVRKYEKTTLRMSNIEEKLKTVLSNLGLEGDVYSRLKHFYSLYKKIRDKGTAKIYDIIAYRIIIDKTEDCYRVLGEIHKMFRPVPGRIKDYIASPKANGYQSLHTTVITKDGTPFEVQIRTHDMHKYCEYGIAAHWRYKTGDQRTDEYETKLNWLKSIIENEKQIKDSENFVKALQMDFSTSEIWVFTPKYKPISLPENSTPIDFAYAIHTDLGNTCVGAKINGRRVPLSATLETGDVVEILVNKDSRGPQREWLKIAVSTNARSHIRAFFRKSTMPENIKKGREMLEEKAREMNVPFNLCLLPKTISEVMHRYLVYSLEDMFACIATGGIREADIINIAMKNNGEEPETKKEDIPLFIEGSEIEGVKFAHCCMPIPGDDIYAIVSNSAITVHCSSCPNLKNIDKERLLSAQWKDNINMEFTLSLKIGGKDQEKIVSNVINVFYENNIRIVNLNAKIAGEGRFEILVELKIHNIDEFEDIKSKIENIPNVMYVNRNNLA